MERVPGEQRGDEHARPQFTREPEQQEEKQNHIRRVKQHVDEMVRAGVEAEEFAVRHVREPGERMPVARVTGGERPFDSRPRQSFLHDGIFRDVILIVVIHKTVARRRQISQQRDECEQQANETRTGHGFLLRDFFRRASAENFPWSWPGGNSRELKFSKPACG